MVVAACNPLRRNLTLDCKNGREIDLGRSWSSGHYQVSELPASLTSMKWSFGSLKKDQEKDFIFQRLKKWKAQNEKAIPPSLQIVLTEIISASQEAMRNFAMEDLRKNLQRQEKYTNEEILREATARSKSVVSLRDIQRVFVLFEFFLLDFPAIPSLQNSDRHQNAMLLAIAVVYYMRLDSASRDEYLDRLRELSGEIYQVHCLYNVLDAAMEHVALNTRVKDGIARTRGLKENLFMTLVCAMSKMPLMIVGPPGAVSAFCSNLVLMLT